MTGREIWRAAGRMVLQAIVGAIIILGIVIGLSGPSQQERRETNQNVRKLVMEAQKNREVLCLAVVHNPANVASDDPRILELCAEIGVVP
jgi:hypothetical protein